MRVVPRLCWGCSGVGSPPFYRSCLQLRLALVRFSSLLFVCLSVGGRLASVTRVADSDRRAQLVRHAAFSVSSRAGDY